MSFQGFAVPGKLMLAGEYAVLEPDGLAVAFATGQLVDVRPRDGQGAVLSAFGGTWPVEATATGLALLAWRAGQLARQTWGVDPAVPVQLRVAGQLDGRKVGLGTSAAVTVAFLQAIAASYEIRCSDNEIAELARSAHRAGQGGGSGYDVTTIAHGGVIAYRRGPDRAEPLAWPEGLAMAALFSGEPAATVDALLRRERLAPFLPSIHVAAEVLLCEWKSSNRTGIIEALAACEAALEVAAVAVPELLPEAVQRVKRHCAAYGLVARTSGAGGGDCVLAVGQPARVEAAVHAWQAQGGAIVAVLPEQLATTAQAAPASLRGHAEDGTP